MTLENKDDNQEVKTKLNIKENVLIEHRDKDGNVKSRRVENLITSAGKAFAASRWGGSGGEAALTYLAVGSGTTAAAVGDTTLETEITTNGLARASATVSRTTTTVTNDTATTTHEFSVTGTQSVTEAALFNAGAAGTMPTRVVFTADSLENGDTYSVTFNHSFS